MWTPAPRMVCPLVESVEHSFPRPGSRSGAFSSWLGVTPGTLSLTRESVFMGFMFTLAAYVLPDGTVRVDRLKTHAPELCAGERCVIHNPSEHHMRGWLLNWRGDRGLMERICPHGMGHPDPDHMAYIRRFQPVMGAHSVTGIHSVHGCDGCCRKKK